MLWLGCLPRRLTVIVRWRCHTCDAEGWAYKMGFASSLASAVLRQTSLLGSLAISVEHLALNTASSFWLINSE